MVGDARSLYLRRKLPKIELALAIEMQDYVRDYLSHSSRREIRRLSKSNCLKKERKTPRIKGETTTTKKTTKTTKTTITKTMKTTTTKTTTGLVEREKKERKNNNYYFLKNIQKSLKYFRNISKLQF